MRRYAVDYEADFSADRSRLTTFFRLLLVLPHLLVVSVVGIGWFFAVVAAWFSIVITGRLPQGLHSFIVGFLRLAVQVGAYALLVTDRFPPFSLDAADHPVRVAAPDTPKPSYDRLKAAFRIFLAIPWAIISTAYMYVAYLAALGAWFAIVFTGRQPELLQRGLNMGLAAQLHYNAFLSLAAEDWPPFEPELRVSPQAAPVAAGPEAPRISGV